MGGYSRHYFPKPFNLAHNLTISYSNLVQVITFAMMIEGDKRRIRTILMVNYSDILNKGRKGVKGLRMQHLHVLMFIGDNEGITASEAAKIEKISAPACYQKFKRVMRVGFVCKVGMRYYLTESGLKVYNTICREFDAAMDELVRVLVAESIK